MPPPGATTIQSEPTLGGAASATVLAIRWVFPELDGRVTVLERTPLVIGREPGVDVVLPGEQVSRRHAEVWKEGVHGFIRDLDSRNGIRVGGRRVKEAHLEEGVVVRLGEWVGVVVEVPRGEVD